MLELDEERITDILNKVLDPENVNEEILLLVYEYASQGTPLNVILLALPAEFDAQNLEMLYMVVLGYSEGQVTYIETNTNKETVNYNKH